jgi:Rrf2 family protein
MLQPKSPTYALLAVTEIARQQTTGKRGAQAKELARTFGLPVAYLARILSMLAADKILRSRRGPRGGFHLARSPATITCLDVIQAVGGVEDLHDAIAAIRAPTKLRQGLTAVFRQAADATRKSLDSITIQRLAASGSRK